MYKYSVTVRGYELDSYGHVNHAVYLNYLEQSRWEILKELQLFDYLHKNELLLVVTELNIRYKQEAKLFDELVINTNITKKPPYLIFLHKIYNSKTKRMISEARVKTLLIDKNRIPHDIPAEFKTDPLTK